MALPSPPSADWQHDLRLIADALSAVPAGSEPVTFWWRDDDATKDSENLRKLVAIAQAHATPLCLAVIPRKLKPSLTRVVKKAEGVSIAVHGWDHRSHADADSPKSEFSADREAEDVLLDVTRGLWLLKGTFGARMQPVLVPPWNRFADVHYPHLVRAGYQGISISSTKQPAIVAVEEGLTRADVHFNIARTAEPRGLADVTTAAARVAKQIAAGSRGPFGIITHHKAHTGEVWDFCDAFWAMVAEHPNARAIGVAEVFDFAQAW